MSVAHSTAPRQRSSENALLDAAFAEFIAVGVRRSTMDGIARAAAMSRASLYRYYSSKEDIFRGVVERVWNNVITDAERAWELHDNLEDRLVHVINAKLDLWIDICASSHGSEIVDSENLFAGDINRKERERYINLIKRLIDDAQRRHPGTGVPGVSSRTIAEIIESWVQATRLRPGTARSRHRYVTDAVRFFATKLE